jgi:hypothetical protein
MSGLPGIDIAGIVKANKGQHVSDYISSHFLLRLSRRSLGTTRKVSVSLMGISLPPFLSFLYLPAGTLSADFINSPREYSQP